MSFKRLLSDMLNNGCEENFNSNKISKRKPRKPRMIKNATEDAHQPVMEYYSLELGI